MPVIDVKFEFEYDTKGAVRYREVDDKGDMIRDNNNAKIGSLYIRKKVFGDKIPGRLTVKIDY